MRPFTAPVTIVALLLALLSAPGPAAAADATVAGFSPQGTVKDVRQAAARFSEPMVAFGDPRGAPDPFVVQCPEPGTGRWVDPRQWVYDFARDLPGGLRCTFQLRPGLQTLDGRPVTAPGAFTFTTGGPSIRDSTPRAGSEWIDEEQAFLLVLDAAPTPESLERHVGFSVEGLPQRVGARVVTGAPRNAIVRTRYPRGSAPGPHVVVLQPRQRLPNGARVSLVWGKDVASQRVSPRRRTRGSSSVRPRLHGSLRPASASDGTPTACRCRPCACVSRRRWPWAQARRVALRGPGGRRWGAALANGDPPPHGDGSPSGAVSRERRRSPSRCRPTSSTTPAGAWSTPRAFPLDRARPRRSRRWRSSRRASASSSAPIPCCR